MNHAATRPTAWRAAIVVDASMVMMMVVPTDADDHARGVAIVVIAVVIARVCVAAVSTAVAPIAVIVNVLHLRGSSTGTLVHDKRRCTGRANAEAGRDSECRVGDTAGGAENG